MKDETWRKAIFLVEEWYTDTDTESSLSNKDTCQLIEVVAKAIEKS